jgi:predicted RNase H-like HicB family nuclease
MGSGNKHVYWLCAWDSRGAYTRETLGRIAENLKEVLGLCLEEYQDAGEALPRFVRLQQIEVAG